MGILTWIAIGLGLAAAVDDLRRRAISNWISVSGLVAALICQTACHGLRGLGLGAAGAAIGFAVFLVVYVMGGMGGGDLKLMAAFGAILGPAGILTAALLTAIVGGLIAAGSLALSRPKPAIPYAPAIVLGAWLALLGGR